MNDDVVEANALLHDQEVEAFADVGCQGAGKRPDARADMHWYSVMPTSKRGAGQGRPREVLFNQLEG
ncbi:MAG TPA: hypothetical protein VL051_05620 [Burkholderiaceae bacterium]|nr:hypothetical protein [Burkholderiaceae bacterium]